MVTWTYFGIQVIIQSSESELGHSASANVFVPTHVEGLRNIKEEPGIEDNNDIVQDMRDIYKHSGIKIEETNVKAECFSDEVDPLDVSNMKQEIRIGNA